MNTLVYPLDSKDVSLAVVGGKASNLFRLKRAGESVPDGFVVSIEAYRRFIKKSLGPAKQLELQRLRPSSAGGMDGLSAKIQTLLESARLPPGLRSELVRAYASLGEDREGIAVAVRSSANVEDLADHSFAGQYETSLNVRGIRSLEAAVLRCWQSLWSPAVIQYRESRGLSHDDVAMAVLVQVMVPVDQSGVVFTANSMNGNREELLVNASFGLGEAIVGSEVNPDTFVVDRETLEILEVKVGEKKVMRVPDAQKGTRLIAVPRERQVEKSLQRETIQSLAQTCLRVELLLGGEPQDIEFALAREECWVLQSRPITTLSKTTATDPQWTVPPGAEVLVRRQVVENMPEPLSPLFDDL